MKKSQLRQIIKEEIKRSLLEGEGDWKETFNSKIKTINPNDYTSATHLATYIKQILTGTMGESALKEQTITLRKLNADNMDKYNSYQIEDSQGKDINLATAVIGGIDATQGPDDGTSGAYLESVSYADGTPVPEQELENINNKHYATIAGLAVEFFHNAV